MTAPVGLFYGSSTCYTEIAAEKIAAILGSEIVDIFNLADTPVSTMNEYRFLILGIPTWDYGELQEDWENCWDELDSLDFSKSTVAIYGLGDQQGYPEWFQDAMGYLWAKVRNQGASTIGLWPVDDYTFEQSKALTDDGQYFVGLALDEDSQFEQSEARINEWCEQIKREFGL